MKITIVFKNGYSFTITCDKFTIKRDVFGQLTGYDIEGIKDHKLMYIDLEDVMCVYRDMGTEETDG